MAGDVIKVRHLIVVVGILIVSADLFMLTKPVSLTFLLFVAGMPAWIAFVSSAVFFSILIRWFVVFFDKRST
ncbi:hypothetical protein CHH27_06340 [Labrenzia sp. VG12]|nr:hypothetical protein CHH27_06340 [Labrenzia sp. VG12]